MLVLQGHTNSVQALAYTPDGATLISAGDDCTIRLWDVRTGDEIAWMRQHDNAILTLAVSSNGRWLASAGHDKRVRVWDLPQRRLTERRYPAFESTVNAVAFDPEGQRLAAGADRGFHEPTLRIFELPTLIVYHAEEGMPWTTAIWSLAYAPNSDLAVGYGSGAVMVQIEEEPWGVRPVLQHNSGVTALAFAPDGVTLVALSSNTVFVWDVQKGELRRTLGTHGGRISSVAFTPDGRFLITGGWDSTVRLWDVETGQERRRFDWHLGKRINAVAIAPDGMTAAAAGDAHDIVIWDIDDL